MPSGSNDADSNADSRRARQLANQRRAREKNDRHLTVAPAAGPILGLVCECGHDHCTTTIVMTDQEYRAVRGRERYFAVTPEHVIADVDIVRSRHVRFVVVESPEA